MSTTISSALRRRLAVIAMAFAVVGALFTVAPQAEASPVQMALPATRAELNLNILTQRHHDYPAVDIPVPQGTTARAIFNGRVASVFYEGNGCGWGVVLNTTTADGTRLETMYCHARVRPTVAVGQLINAFQPVLSTGMTGSATGPHLHIQVKRNGVKVCPQNGLRAAWNQQNYDWNTAPTTGCFY